MHPRIRKAILLVSVCLGLGMCSHADTSASTAPQPTARPIVLDIGHQSTSRGAQTPDKTINEFDFWCRYAGEIKNTIEQAGYPCIILNRGNAPTKGASAEQAKAAGVVFLNHPDKNARRYPSTHHPAHIGAGMICADKAIDLRARCVVFLHLNSVSNAWSSTPPTGLIICNRQHGHALAESVCSVLRAELLDQPGGIPNAGKGVKVLPRYIGSQPSAGWMNTLDEEKIPAIVFEALYTNYRAHMQYISQEAQARKLARAIGQGVVNWLQATPAPAAAQ